VKLVEKGGNEGSIQDLDLTEEDADKTASQSTDPSLTPEQGRFQTGSDQNKVDFKVRSGQVVSAAAPSSKVNQQDPLALGDAVNDEIGGSFRDEELPPPQTPPLALPAHKAAPVNVGEYADMQLHVGGGGVSASGGGADRSAGAFGAASLISAGVAARSGNQTATKGAKTAFAEKKKVVSEYDEELPAETKEQQQLEAEAEHRDDGAVLDGEQLTKEDMKRVAKKDGVMSLEKRHGVSPGKHSKLRRLGLGNRRRVVLKSVLQRRGKTMATVFGSRAKKSKKLSHAQVRSDGTSDAMAPGPAKMKTQCMSFASFLGTQDIQGTELLRVVKSTCQPAVMEGTATPDYQMMCDALGGAVEKFVVSPTWSPDELCDAMIQVFNEAKIGDLAR